MPSPCALALRLTLALLLTGCHTQVGLPLSAAEPRAERQFPRAQAHVPEAAPAPLPPPRQPAPTPWQPAPTPWQPPPPHPPVASPSPRAPLPAEVRVAPALLVLTAGEARGLKATVAYADGTLDGNVTWASSDNRIVTVNPTTGQVQARQEGVVTVVAASALAPERKALVTVTVHRGLVEEALVRVEPRSASLRVGETAELTATVQLSDGTLSPNVAWTSTNRAVALVSGAGLVTAVGPGRATITAVSTGDGTRRASCEVTVTE